MYISSLKENRVVIRYLKMEIMEEIMVMKTTADKIPVDSKMAMDSKMVADNKMAILEAVIQERATTQIPIIRENKTQDETALNVN
jgi:hypothetical protein